MILGMLCFAIAGGLGAALWGVGIGLGFWNVLALYALSGILGLLIPLWAQLNKADESKSIQAFPKALKDRAEKHFELSFVEIAGPTSRNG